MNQQPKVYIFLASYNRAKLILETLNSIVNQTYKNWECIIVDDNSKDNTKQVVKKLFVDKDSRFKFYTKDNNKYSQGLGGSRNMSLDLAEEFNAEYIHFFDDDDLMHPRKLEMQMNLLTSNPDLSFVTCEYEHFEPEKLNFEELRSSKLPLLTKNLIEDFVMKNKNKIYLNSCGPIWDASVWKDVRFNESLKIAEEYEVYSRLFIKLDYIKYNAVQNILFYYRKHELSNTKNRYLDWEIKESLYNADLNIFEALVSEGKMSKHLLKYYIKKHIIISFDYVFCSKIEEYIKGKQLTFYNLVLKSFFITKKIFIKIL